MKLSKEVKVGLLATTTLTILYLGFNFLQGKNTFSSSNIHYTTYDHASGLATSSPVLINGITVGRVKSLTILPEKNYSALVAFEIKKHIKLTDATTAKLISHSLLGGKAIELLIKEGSLLQNYATVPGKIEPSFGEIFSQDALPALNNAKDIALLANKFVAGLAENTDKINNIFSSIEEVAQQLKKSLTMNQEGLHTFSQNLAEISSMLANKKNGIPSLLAKLQHLADEIENIEIKNTTQKVNHILENIAKVLDKTTQKENSISMLLYNDELYRNLNQSLVDLDKLLVDLRAHPYRYINFSLFGKQKFKYTEKE